MVNAYFCNHRTCLLKPHHCWLDKELNVEPTGLVTSTKDALICMAANFYGIFNILLCKGISNHITLIVMMRMVITKLMIMEMTSLEHQQTVHTH